MSAVRQMRYSADMPHTPVPVPRQEIPDTAEWHDTLGRTHDLTKVGTLALADAAKRLHVTRSAIRQKIQAGIVYPVLRNGEGIRVYEVALDDYIIRSLLLAYPHLRDEAKRRRARSRHLS